MPYGIYLRTDNHRLQSIKNLGIGMLGKTPSKKTRKKMSEAQKGEKSHLWKGGITKNINRWRREYRHRLGISKKYNSELGISHTKEYKKLQGQKRRALFKGGGELSIQTVQLVYEDNIKRYGTLTCYLCGLPIEFGNDHLEHKTPLSRGGTNARENLDIAHQKCNNRKHTKTETEYREEIFPNGKKIS